MADDIWILEDQIIPVSFDTKGYTFYKGGKGIPGTPMEKFLQLVAVKGDDKVLIPTIPDLKGRVVIKSPEEALEFVRLFTAPDTHYLFRDSRYIEPNLMSTTPTIVEYSDDYQKQMNLQPPETGREDSVFTIQRNLVTAPRRLIRARERVGADGEYSIVETQVIDEHSPISYPLYQ